MTLQLILFSGLCRADDDEHVRIQNHLARMQNVAFDFLKNPRSEKPASSDIFDAVPPQIVFRKWSVGTVLETILEIRNKDTVSRSVTILPPENPRFHLGLGRYPSQDGRVGPGMSVSYRVQFMPDTLADDACEIEVRHPGGTFKGVGVFSIKCANMRYFLNFQVNLRGWVSLFGTFQSHLRSNLG